VEDIRNEGTSWYKINQTGKIKEIGDFLSTDPHKVEKNSERTKVWGSRLGFVQCISFFRYILSISCISGYFLNMVFSSWPADYYKLN